MARTKNNPIARALRSPFLTKRVVKARKGKGSFQRKARTMRGEA